jgi:protein CLEC16A
MIKVIRTFSNISDAFNLFFAVGDESVNDYVVSPPHTEYFSKLISFFQKQCMDLSAMVLNTLK